MKTNLSKSIQTLAATLLICLLNFSCSTWKIGKTAQQKIAGKTYVIVGASSGFGRGVAEELGRCKANVVLAARRTELLEEIATRIRESGGKAQVVTMDISKPEDLQHVADDALQQFGRIDVWVNMAGVGAIGRFWDIPDADHSRIIDVNLKGFIYGSKVAIKQFMKQGYGVLMNMGSVDSETPLAYHASYSASKAGVRNLSLAVGQELRLHGYKNIKVVTVEPWAVDTPWWRHAANYSGVEPKMALMDEPYKVVNVMLRKSLRPKKIAPVGFKAKLSSFMANVFPRFNEWLTGNVSHRYQIEMPPKASNTNGSIYEPMKEGTGIDDGVDERMKEQKRKNDYGRD
ncbi:short-subunit dehydrogenase [Chryseobacterium ginsenosidimutans]|uniref:SDR family NAD(P)-dependent oxidoreductase n=1 Tax=Chryseobacterium ginsenosidimutans TaxID=687846 RepID=UPI002781050B|nr:SDR family NAD(P)-dependent oxidoreductase [Chryseobacterium ginsenosidimutans]MDQ0594807.1 short-subunit dehydrogenase [Chryseobacterium ginsenosidimutans]